MVNICVCVCVIAYMWVEWGGARVLCKLIYLDTKIGYVSQVAPSRLHIEHNLSLYVLLYEYGLWIASARAHIYFICLFKYTYMLLQTIHRLLHVLVANVSGRL